MKKNVLYVMSCLVLLVLLGAFMTFCKKEEQKQIDSNRKAWESMKDDVQSEMTDKPQNKTETVSDKENTADESSSEQGEGGLSAEPAEDENQVPLISLRGDAFVKDEDIEESGVGTSLKKLLEEKQITAQVNEYVMYKSGSMSHLRLAGVAEDKIEAYRKRHEENKDNIKLSIYEKKVRDAADMDLTRDDQEGIPVICMGYNGGWYNDLDELTAQIQDVLDTYSQQEKYIIVGLYPDVKVKKEDYDQKMTEAWGDHYIQVDDKITHSLSKADGSQDMAEAIFEKLQEMGYLKAGE